MSNRQKFTEYAEAFEQTLNDNRWERLRVYFAADAVYLPGDGTSAQGPDQIVAMLEESVNGFDRRFDSRQISGIDELEVEGDEVRLPFTVIYSSEGETALCIRGVETATYADGAICRLADEVDEESIEAVQAWSAQQEADGG